MSTNRRFPAEWEPQQLVQFTFPHPASDWAEHWPAILNVFVELVAAVLRFQEVLVVTHDRNLTQKVLAHLPQQRLHLVGCPSN
ncbi:MAG: agmatine deiminase family protein, partial [Bacteroidota bacterium]